jgi:hypothetical protein
MPCKRIKDILKISGCNIAAIEQELFQINISHIAIPSREVVDVS